MTSSGERGIDTTRPHPARRYNYWLGGKDHFQADRDSAAMIEELMPSVAIGARENRSFHGRAVRHLAAEAGIRQFVDIGAGLPAPENTHEIAQDVDPTARIVYVDNDPLVLVHARALLTGPPQGRTAYIEADLRDPDRIISDLWPTLDRDRPVAVLLVAVLHFILDDDDPYGLVSRLVDAVPSGSYLVVSHATADFMPPQQLAMVEAANAAADRREDRVRLRSQAEVERFFDGLDLVPPGVCCVGDWRPADPGATRPTPADICAYGGVARVP
jgi:O-methyltransferase involved in polyketide biosynthesis